MNNTDKFLEWCYNSPIRFFLLVIIFTFSLSYFFVWISSKEPRITLFKKDWNCTKEHYSIRHYPMIIGKITIMKTHSITICDEYKRINSND